MKKSSSRKALELAREFVKTGEEQRLASIEMLGLQDLFDIRNQSLNPAAGDNPVSPALISPDAQSAN